MTEDKITNIEELPLDVWKELKRNAETGLRNAKISYWQHNTLLELCAGQISRLKTDDDKSDSEAVKDLVKELVA